jgi:drug/metabolite transporter (DMT)-like permease
MFALEGVIAQSCFKKVNPATFTGLVFSVEWAVLSIAAVFLIQINLNGGLLVMGLLLCFATLLGYLFNNFGIRAIGAAPASIIGSSDPAVTAILGLLILSDGLKAEQWFAILLVTVGVVAMNLARLRLK